MRNKLIKVIALLLLTACSEAVSLNKNERKSFYKNGKIHEHYFVDENNKHHGKYEEYSEDGSSWVSMHFFHGKEIFAKFYKKGELIQQRTRRFKNDNGIEGFNVVVEYDNNNKIIESKSLYANLAYRGENKDSLLIDLHGYYNDSIVVNFCNYFENDIFETKVIRYEVFENLINPKIVVDIQEKDYINGVLNIMVKSYDKYVPSPQPKGINYKIHVNAPLKIMLIQLKKGEEPKKYNLDPIW